MADCVKIRIFWSVIWIALLGLVAWAIATWARATTPTSPQQTEQANSACQVSRLIAGMSAVCGRSGLAPSGLRFSPFGRGLDMARCNAQPMRAAVDQDTSRVR